MRLFIFILFSGILLTSCGTNKLRLVRAEKQIVVDNTTTISTQNNDADQVEIENRIENNIVSTEDELFEFPEGTISSNTPAPTDTLKGEEAVDFMTSEALKTQRIAGTSLGSTIGSYVALGGSIVCIFAAAYEVAFVLLFLSLALFITGIVLVIISFARRYTTPRGKRLSIASLILLGLPFFFWLIGAIASL